MQSESGYYFVSLLTAVAFIENVDATKLSITSQEFEQGNTILYVKRI
jgi:hypothetical protein